MQGSVFNLPFQIVFYHALLSNSCNNVFSSAWSSCLATIYYKVYSRHNQLKTRKIRIIWWKYISGPRSLSHEEYSCFDFPAYSMFTFDEFCGSLGTSIFGSSSPNNTRSRLPSRLSFRYEYGVTSVLEIRRKHVT